MTENLPAEVAENLADFCEQRRRVYVLLSRCFERELDAASAEELAEAARVESDDPAVAEAFAALSGDLAQRDEAELDELAVVYNRVFYGMGPRTAQKAFPYESVYTSLKGLMMQDAYSEVVQIYRAAQFAKAPDFKEPEDHVAIELAFMARLCERAVEALRAGDEDAAEHALREQQDFLQNHLLNWIDRFLADVKTAAESGFYRDLAVCAEAYLHADETALAEVVA